MLKNNPYMKAYLNIINEDVDNIEKYQSIADEIGGVYIPETNTIDCKGNEILFKDEWLNKDGSFDFKLINTSNNWSYMFDSCYSLTHLPDDFIIPDDVIDCYGMFQRCYNLTHLPNNFIIPDSVTDCSYMFYDCFKLTYLPENFTIPDNVENCESMFWNCESLIYLPNNFHISCDTKYKDIFVGCDKLKNKDPEAYKMLEI